MDFCATIGAKMFMRRWFKFKSEREKSLWSFLSGQLLKTKGDLLDSEIKINANRRRMFLTGTVLALIVILFFVIEPTFAGTSVTKTIANWAIGILAKIVVWLAEQLGYILIFLIELLINVVQYNNFVKATPVQIGWPLIRDTVNMFFIVVVLVSAFATIIGYPKDFNYKQVLPKLLVMAILINFSKTLIGLLIDFSQVIVLTFVNGFKQAAGGNFVSALGIAKIMRLTATTGTIEESADGITLNISNANSTGMQPWSLMSILVSAIFAIWIISISISLILIMLIFFLARIIMLWFLLITSPVAFFAWSLPGQLKNALGSFTNEWWSRLSSALVGGPTMAFFLWLSLAMAQRQADLVGPTGIYDPAKVSTEVTQFQQSTKQSGQVTPSEFGNPNVFATFIIMVAFMLVGVQTSVKFASSVAPGTEKLVGALGSSKAGFGLAGGAMAGMLAGRVAARGARVAGTGVKIAGKGALAVGREVEARTGFVAGQAKKLQKSGVFAYAPISVQKAIGGVAAAPSKAAKERAEVLKGIGSTMTSLEYAKYLEDEAGKMQFGRREGDINGVQMAQAQLAMSSIYQDELNEKNKKIASDQLGTDASPDAVAARAKELTNEHISGQLVRAETFARASQDEDMIKKIKEMREKNPALAEAGTKRAEQAKRDASDTQSERKIKPEAFMDATYALNYAHAKKWIDDEGRKVVGADNDPEFKKFMTGKQGQYMSAHMEYARTEAGKAQVKQIITGKNAAGAKVADEAYKASNYTINVSKDGEQFHVVQNQNFSATGVAREASTSGRFDKTTKDPEVILKHADDRSKQLINNNMGALGQVRDENGQVRSASVSDLGRQISPKVAQNLGMQVAALQAERDRGDDKENIIKHRSEIAQEFLQHDISATALFGHDAKSGDFADDEGKEAFKRTVEELSRKISEEGDYGQETMSALSSLAKQMGTKGDGFKIMQQAMSNMNQGQILNAMNAGMPEQKKNVRNMFMNVVAQADRDMEDGLSNTPAMKIRESAIKPPPPGSPGDDFKTASAVHRILFEGK